MFRLPFALVLIVLAAGYQVSLAQSVTAASCSRAKTKTLKECNTKIATDRAGEQTKTTAKSAECAKSKATSECARDLAALSGSAASKNTEAIKECTDKKKSCEDECDENKIGAEFLGDKRRIEADKIKKTKKECVQEFDKLLGKLGSEAGQASGSQAGGTSTADSSKGENKEQAAQQQQPQQPPPQQPPPAQSSQSPQAPQAPQSPQATPPTTPTETPKAEADPCTGANANLYSQCKAKIAERCASQSPGAVGFGTPDPECVAAKNGTTAPAVSATCARFKQQCASNTAGCLKSMSATEQAKIQSECLGGDGQAADGPTSGTAGFQTASTSSSSAGGSSAGGGSGGSTPGTSAGATLTDDYERLKKQYDAMGSREGTGDNLHVDSGGGYSGGGGDGGGSSSESSPMSLGRGRSSPSAERTIASQSVPNSANATDVDGRYGRSVFSISTDVLKARCAKGRLLHCTPEVK